MGGSKNRIGPPGAKEKNMDEKKYLTETVHLSRGVILFGKRHKTVVLRESVTMDTFEVERKCEGKGVAYCSVALLGEAIVEFGTVNDLGEFTARIPKEEIDMDLLGQLNDEDLERLYQARDYLKKKPRWLRDD